MHTTISRMDDARCRTKSVLCRLFVGLVALVGGLSAPVEVKALGVTTTNIIYIDNTKFYNGTSGPSTATTNGTGTFSNGSVTNNLNGVTVTLRNNIPANSIFSMEWNFETTGTNANIFGGISGIWKINILSQECFNADGTKVSAGGSTKSNFTCKVIGYSEVERNTIGTAYGVPIITANGNTVNWSVSNPTYIQLNYNGLSADDRTWLSEQLGGNTDAVEDLQTTIENEYTQTNTGATTNNSDANSLGNGASSAIADKQSLLGLGYDLVQTLTRAETNCIVDWFGGSLETTPYPHLNLCQGEGTAILTMIRTFSSAVLVIWTYHAGKNWYLRFVRLINEVSR